jgi:hypothetical protein
MSIPAFTQDLARKTTTLLAAATLGLSAQAQTRLPPAQHPVLGTWQWTDSRNGCTEVYDFRPDGTVPVVSGDERTDNTFTISDTPDAQGFYTLTLFTVKDHGGKDCGGDETDNTAMENVIYLLFEPGLTEFIICAEQRLESCFGPWRRVRK